MPEQQRFPCVRRVTSIAVLARNKMPGWLALGRAAVVAARATAGDIGMIKVGRQPRDRRMAGVAFTGSWQVLRMLAGRDSAVVAATAGSRHYVCMIEHGRNPAIGRMAVVAVVAARNVICGFAFGDAAVVTGAAGADYLRVIDPDDGFPCSRAMTIFADVRRAYVIGPLALGDAPVVATEAVASEIVVIKGSRDPRCRVVAILAVITASDVSWRLASRNGAVVTTAAAAYRLKMIDTPDR